MLIEEERKKEEEARLKDQEQQLDQQFGDETAWRNVSNQKSMGTGAQWYFYNDAAKNLGYREFKLKWGNRKLEDHWQRASKAMVSYSPVNQEEEDAMKQRLQQVRMLSAKYHANIISPDIPTTDSAVEATINKMELGIYNMGMIYKDDLKDYDKAVESFKELIKRFPVFTYLLASYYNLYSIARDQNNQALVDYYKNNIIRQFPESMYAKVLTNPEYFKELEKEDQAVRQYYEQTYELYTWREIILK